MTMMMRNRSKVLEQMLRSTEARLCLFSTNIKKSEEPKPSDEEPQKINNGLGKAAKDVLIISGAAMPHLSAISDFVTQHVEPSLQVITDYSDPKLVAIIIVSALVDALQYKKVKGRVSYKQFMAFTDSAIKTAQDPETYRKISKVMKEYCSSEAFREATLDWASQELKLSETTLGRMKWLNKVIAVRQKSQGAADLQVVDKEYHDNTVTFENANDGVLSAEFSIHPNDVNADFKVIMKMGFIAFMVDGKSKSKLAKVPGNYLDPQKAFAVREEAVIRVVIPTPTSSSSESLVETDAEIEIPFMGIK